VLHWVVLALASCSADARAGNGDPLAAWVAKVQVDEVVVRIHWVSYQELLAVARTHGKRPQTRAMGFSVLRKLENAYRCDIYMPRQPGRVADRITAALGHEIAHCWGLSHDD
jgi:hypothetical protein